MGEEQGAVARPGLDGPLERPGGVHVVGQADLPPQGHVGGEEPVFDVEALPAQGADQPQLGGVEVGLELGGEVVDAAGEEGEPVKGQGQRGDVGGHEGGLGGVSLSGVHLP